MAGFVCECCGEQTDLFGRGGGEVMAEEFGVRFLAGVGMDGAWGRLVEEGRRPVYGSVGRAEGENCGDDDEEEGVEEGDERRKRAREDGLLVDKYRSCKLWWDF